MNKHPDPTIIYLVPDEDGQDPFDVTYIKPTIIRPNIIVGDFSYYSGANFESRVTHHYRDNGIETTVWLCPILPWINDSEETCAASSTTALRRRSRR
jgi:hypothetical protein